MVQVTHVVRAELAVNANNVIYSPSLSMSYCHLKYLSRLRLSCCPHLLKCWCQMRYRYILCRYRCHPGSYDPRSNCYPHRSHGLNCLHCFRAQCFFQCLAVREVCVRLGCKVFAVCATAEGRVFRAFQAFIVSIIDVLDRNVHDFFVMLR